MRTPLEALDAACAALGGQQQLADALSQATPDRPCSTSAISQWRTRMQDGGLFPEERAEPVEAVTKRAVTCEELRPDLLWHRNGRGAVVAVARPIQPTPRRAAAAG